MAESDRLLVERTYAAWDQAFNAQDAQGVAALYLPDATFLPATHQVIQGPADIARFFEGVFATGITAHRFELITMEGNGVMLVAAARWFAQGTDAQGAATALDGIATHLFLHQPDGTLRLRLHTFN